MKNSFIPPLIVALLACTFPAGAQDKPAEKSGPASEAKSVAEEAVDFSTFKNADEFWDYIVKIGAEKPPTAKSQEEFMQIVESWLKRQRIAAETFIKKYPEEPRRWDAKIVMLMAANQLQRVGGKPLDPAASLKEIEAVLAAPEATPETKMEAAYLHVQMLGQSADAAKPETLALLEKGVAAFLGAYPESKRAPEIAEMQMQLIQMEVVPDPDEALKKLAASKNEEIAESAKRMIAQKEKMAALKKKPMELKFTATDGKEFDLAKLRGKVVLVDFWASWCGPCIAEMPNVVAAYKKLHIKGFEIAGISLDEDKAAMAGAIKKHGMTWTQYFDGKGWQNKISSEFGIDSIPAAWLLDKKGLLRETGLRGDELAREVEKLLAE